MGRSGRIGIILVVAGAFVTASCASPGPTGGPTQATTGNALSALSLPADGSAELVDLLGIPGAKLDATQTKLRDAIVQQLAPTLGPAPVPQVSVVDTDFHPAIAKVQNVSDVGIGFLLIEVGVIGQAMPSKDAAGMLVSLAGELAGPTRDAADSDRIDDKTDSSPFTATSEASTAAGSMDRTIGANTDHSLVSVHFGRMLNLDYTKGSDSGHLVIDIDSEESVDACPDESGSVPVKIHSVFTMISDTETVTATIEGTFTGQTDGQANLVSVTGHAAISGETTSGTSTSSDYGGTLDGVVLKGGKATDGTYEGTGSGLGLAVGAAVVDIENSVPSIFEGVRKVWQDSGCVALEVPDLTGRASFGEGGSASVVKDVDPKSKTDFTVQVHDRFRHIDVDLPLTMALDAKESIDPTSVSSIPASVNYEAPSTPGEINNVVLESKSLQGSTKFTARFRTVLPKLVLSITGTLTSQISAGATLTAAVTVKKTLFDENVFENDVGYVQGNASATGRLRMTFAAGSPPCGAVVGTESGTEALLATIVAKDDGTSTWSVHADPAASSFKTVDTCVITKSFDFGASGGYIPKMFAAIGTFSLPTAPGTYTLSGSKGTPNGTDSATMTVTVYPSPPNTK